MFLKIEKENEIGEKEAIEIELSEKLNTALNIQKAFANKPFIEVARGIGKMKIEDLITFLVCALKPGQMTTQAFRDLVMENVGMGDLFEHVGNLIQAIQYPGLTEEEIEKKVRTQQAKVKRMETGYQESSNLEPLSD